MHCHRNSKVNQRERELIDVLIRDQNDEPLWFIHYEREIDVVAIPLDNFDLKTILLLPVNELAPAKLAIMVGMEVFILGYPFGLKHQSLPIWKRGSIASEPDLVQHSTGYYLVDTASRPGMSGSPVILRSWSNHILESNRWTTSNETRPIDRIIGVYSGRLNPPEDVQIGLVWHVDYIEQIIAGAKRDA